MQAMYRSPQRRHQTGSVVVNAAIALSLIVIVLIGTELGYMFLMKREFQKTVDLAALAGAQKLTPSLVRDICQDAKDAARINAEANLLGVAINTPECGQWAPDTSSEDRFAPGVAAYNALRVTISAAPPVRLFPFFTMDRTIRVKAVAMLDASAATFSVGSQLLRTNPDTLLWKVAKAVGLDTSTLTVLDSEGLAKIKISPSGLLEKLKIGIPLSAGVLTPQSLAQVREVAVGEILAVALDLVSHDTALHTSIKALQASLVNAGLSQVKLNLLGSENSSGGLIKLKTPDPSNASALETQIDLGLLLKTSIGVATSTRAVSIPDLDLLGVSVQAGVVEPPSIGIGGVGARAYNAQVRLYVDVDSDNLLGGALKPLISGLLGTRIHLPIHIDAVTGYGTITALSCQASPPTATVAVESSILRTCVGKSDPTTRFSTKLLCENGLQPERLVKLLHLPLPAETTLQLNALKHNEPLTLVVGETKSTKPNDLELGATVKGLVDALLSTLGSLLNPTSSGGPTPQDRINALADSYLNATKKPNGFYDAVAVVNKFKTDTPSIGDWQRTVTVQDPLVGLFPFQKTMSVWEVLSLQTQPSGGLLGLIGLGQSCAGLLQSLLNWNDCVRSKVLDALNSAPAGAINALSIQVPQSQVSGSGANGFLSALLSPVIAILTPILNGIGKLLSTTLATVLGLELGRTDVTLNSLQCGRSSLVY